MLRLTALAAAFGLCLGACATAPEVVTTPDGPKPVVTEIPTPPVTQPDDPAPLPPEPADPVELPDEVSVFDAYPYWGLADMRPGLAAFQRQCSDFADAPDDQPLHEDWPVFGTLADWREPCALAVLIDRNDKDQARRFFETAFLPNPIETMGDPEGLLTAYYQPEIEVRRVPDSEFSEPILTWPEDVSRRILPRAQITAQTSDVIAYGRPLDVFFMQIQGSGILKYADGTKIRAGYNGNNGYDYTSIGGVLIRRGALTRDSASKQSIQEWMVLNGPEAAKALMNENKRYIFFRASPMKAGEGPLGAAEVPLTAMGSLAVDDEHLPYGLPVWIEVKLPESGGDYQGEETGIMVIAQDTGSAIQGPRRGDIYFGSGKKAGDRAGVMKHDGRWTILLPRALARRYGSIS